MNRKYLAAIFPLILIFTLFAKADVPPDAGFSRISINLVTETTEDLSDYRFFLNFYGDLREVEIKSKARTEIQPMGGGARYRTGTLLAIPKKSLSGFEEKLSNEQLENLSKSLKDNQIKDVVTLAQHFFSRDVPKGEKPPETVYRLTRAENTLNAEKVTEEKPKSASSQLIAPDSRTGTIVGGVLLTLAAVAIGVFAFRKVSKKV